MIRRFAPTLVLAAAVLGIAAAPAAAQGFGVSFGSHGGRSSFAVGFQSGHGGHGGHGRGRYDDHAGRGDYGRGHRFWSPGRYETVARQVWVQGPSRRVWCEPVYSYACDSYGRRTRICVTEGCWRVVQDPGCYETRYVQVWREGCWN